MGNVAFEEVRASAPRSITPEQEDARLAAFFRTVQNGPNSTLVSTIAMMGLDKGMTAKEALGVPYQHDEPAGSVRFFVRSTWLDECRTIITFGFIEGSGHMYIWKARFSADDRLEETDFVGEYPAYEPIHREDALLLWYYGLGVPA
jgi:hypothetical protein